MNATPGQQATVDTCVFIIFSVDAMLSHCKTLTERLYELENVTRGSTDIVVSGEWANYPLNAIHAHKFITQEGNKSLSCPFFTEFMYMCECTYCRLQMFNKLPSSLT